MRSFLIGLMAFAIGCIAQANQRDLALVNKTINQIASEVVQGQDFVTELTAEMAIQEAAEQDLFSFQGSAKTDSARWADGSAELLVDASILAKKEANARLITGQLGATFKTATLPFLGHAAGFVIASYCAQSQGDDPYRAGDRALTCNFLKSIPSAQATGQIGAALQKLVADFAAYYPKAIAEIDVEIERLRNSNGDADEIDEKIAQLETTKAYLANELARLDAIIVEVDQDVFALTIQGIGSGGLGQNIGLGVLVSPTETQVALQLNTAFPEDYYQQFKAQILEFIFSITPDNEYSVRAVREALTSYIEMARGIFGK